MYPAKLSCFNYVKSNFKLSLDATYDIRKLTTKKFKNRFMSNFSPLPKIKFVICENSCFPLDFFIIYFANVA